MKYHFFAILVMACALFTSCGDDEPEPENVVISVNTPEYRNKVSGTYEGTIIKSKEHHIHEDAIFDYCIYTALDTLGKCDVVFNNDGTLSINEFPVEMWSNLLENDNPYKEMLTKCTEMKKIEEPYNLNLIKAHTDREEVELTERSILQNLEDIYIYVDNKNKIDICYEILSQSLKRDFFYIYDLPYDVPIMYVHDGICLRLIKCNAIDEDEHYCYNPNTEDNTVLFIYIDYKFNQYLSNFHS